MSFYFLEGVDFSCGFVLMRENGLNTMSQQDDWDCVPSPGTFLILTSDLLL